VRSSHSRTPVSVSRYRTKVSIPLYLLWRHPQLYIGVAAKEGLGSSSSSCPRIASFGLPLQDGRSARHEDRRYFSFPGVPVCPLSPVPSAADAILAISATCTGSPPCEALTFYVYDKDSARTVSQQILSLFSRHRTRKHSPVPRAASPSRMTSFPST